MTDNETRYFVFDCGKNEKDIEFIIQNWHTTMFNRVREGDYFLYRRSTSASGIGQFYFFGAGKVGKMVEDPEDENGGISCLVENPIPFISPVYQSELLDYDWKFKKRTGTGFQGFFSQYGMTTIKFEDFRHILKLGVAVRE